MRGKNGLASTHDRLDGWKEGIRAKGVKWRVVDGSVVEMEMEVWGDVDVAYPVANYVSLGAHEAQHSEQKSFRGMRTSTERHLRLPNILYVRFPGYPCGG